MVYKSILRDEDDIVNLDELQPYKEIVEIF